MIRETTFCPASNTLLGKNREENSFRSGPPRKLRDQSQHADAATLSISSLRGRFTSVASRHRAPDEKIHSVVYRLNRAVDHAGLRLPRMMTTNRHHGVSRLAAGTPFEFLPGIEVAVDLLAIQIKRRRGIGRHRRGDARVVNSAVGPFGVSRVLFIAG